MKPKFTNYAAMTALWVVVILLFKDAIAGNRTDPYLLLALVVLAVYKAFDSITIGQIVSLRREVKTAEKNAEEKEQQLIRAENERKEIMKQFMATVNLNANQNTVNISGFAAVTPATKEEIKEAREDNGEENNAPKSSLKMRARKKISGKTDLPQPQIDIERAKEIALKRYLDENGIEEDEISKNIKLELGNADGSRKFVVFDAFVSGEAADNFIEIAFASCIITDDIKNLLKSVKEYKKLTGKQARLTLIYCENPLRNSNLSENYLELIKDVFASYINEGLLEIYPVELTEEEIKDITAKK